MEEGSDRWALLPPPIVDLPRLNRWLPCLRKTLFSLARDAAVDHTGVEDGDAAAADNTFEDDTEDEDALLPSESAPFLAALLFISYENLRLALDEPSCDFPPDLTLVSEEKCTEDARLGAGNFLTWDTHGDMGAWFGSGDADVPPCAEMDNDRPGVVPISLRCLRG